MKIVLDKARHYLLTPYISRPKVSNSLLAATLALPLPVLKLHVLYYYSLSMDFTVPTISSRATVTCPALPASR